MKQYIFLALIYTCSFTSLLFSLPTNPVENKLQVTSAQQPWLFVWVMEGLEPEACFEELISIAGYEERLLLETRYFRYLCYQAVKYSSLLKFFEFFQQENAPRIITESPIPQKDIIMTTYKLPLSRNQQNEERVWLGLLKRERKNLTDLRIRFK